MRLWDAAGYLASGLVVLAFCMKDIIPLRVVALTSNIAFLTDGIGLGLVPVWLLHAILLPINCWRLWQGNLAPSRRGPRSREWAAGTTALRIGLQSVPVPSAPGRLRAESGALLDVSESYGGKHACFNSPCNAAVFFEPEIDHFVMAITSAEPTVRHTADCLRLSDTGSQVPEPPLCPGTLSSARDWSRLEGGVRHAK